MLYVSGPGPSFISIHYISACDTSHLLFLLLVSQWEAVSGQLIHSQMDPIMLLCILFADWHQEKWQLILESLGIIIIQCRNILFPFVLKQGFDGYRMDRYFKICFGMLFQSWHLNLLQSWWTMKRKKQMFCIIKTLCSRLKGKLCSQAESAEAVFC